MLKGTMVTPMSASCFLKNLLRLVGAIERLAVGIFAGTGVIAAHDEVRAAMVLADDRMPNGLARSAHAHGERQQGKLRGRLRELGEQQLVAAHSRVVIHVAGLGHAHHRMNQQVGLDLLGGAESQFDVGAVHGVASLEGDHAAPAHAGKLGTNFGRSQDAELRKS